MENQNGTGSALCQAVIENIFLLKDRSIALGCWLLSGAVRTGDKLFYVDGVGRKCFPVTVTGIMIPGRGEVKELAFGGENGNRGMLRIANCAVTELHVGHMLQSEPDEILYQEEPGWDAITACFEKRYPGQKNPAHFGPYACLKAGDMGPLDGISVYNGDNYFHFVTYGLSELFEKQNGNPERSGYGFELTVKLKKEGLENPAIEVRHMCSLLQMVAGVTTNGGHQFLPGQILPLSKQRGIDVNGKSHITGFMTLEDELGTLATPFGKVQLIQLVGITAEETGKMMNKEMTIGQLLENIPGRMTDYKR